MEHANSCRDLAGVVVGVDGSTGADHALEWLQAKPELFGTVTPVLAYRIQGYRDELGSPEFRSKMAEIVVEDARLRLDAALENHPDLLPSARLVQGAVGDRLLEAESAELVVLGSRGRSTLAEFLFGSAGSYCVKHATVPVAVIPEGAEIRNSIDEVVVGIDGSLNAVAALRWAAEHVSPGGRIRAISCFVPMPAVVGAPPVSSEERKAENDLRSAVTAATRSMEGRLEQDDITIETSIEYGDARQVLADHARSADLLVVGARGTHGVPYLFVGSVTTSLLHHPMSATVVVPALDEGLPAATDEEV